MYFLIFKIFFHFLQTTAHEIEVNFLTAIRIFSFCFVLGSCF